MVGEGQPPLWQYFARSGKSDEPIRAPLGERLPEGGYSCKSSTFRGAAMGAMTSMMAPDHPQLSPAVGLEGRMTGGRRVGPVVAVLGRGCKRPR
jgi:hypothetical protein